MRRIYMKSGEEIRSSREKYELFWIGLFYHMSIATMHSCNVLQGRPWAASFPEQTFSFGHVHAVTKCQANLGQSSTCSSPGPKNVHLVKGHKGKAANKTVMLLLRTPKKTWNVEISKMSTLSNSPHVVHSHELVLQNWPVYLYPVTRTKNCSMTNNIWVQPP